MPLNKGVLHHGLITIALGAMSLMAWLGVVLGPSFAGAQDSQLYQLHDSFYRDMHVRAFALHEQPGQTIEILEEEIGAIILAQAGREVSAGVNRNLQSLGRNFFGERFRFESSLGWDVTEGFRGHMQAGIPLLPATAPKNLALLFQPGLVVWQGHRETTRVDMNFGAVARYRPPSGLVALGMNIFYDLNTDDSLGRFGIGLDIQTDYLLLALNGYLASSSSWEAGDTGYQLRTASGVEASAVYHMTDVLQLSATLGGWDNTDVNAAGTDFDDFTFGGKLGGLWQFHPHFALSGDYEFLNYGLGDNRFTLALQAVWPARRGTTTPRATNNIDLYRLAQREQRVLYAERKNPDTTIPPTRFLRVNGQTVLATSSNPITLGSVAEDDATNVSITLSRAFATAEGPLTFEVRTIEGGTNAARGNSCDAGVDYTIKRDEDSQATTGNRLSLTIAAGETTASSSINLQTCADSVDDKNEIILLRFNNFRLSATAPTTSQLASAQQFDVRIPIALATMRIELRRPVVASNGDFEPIISSGLGGSDLADALLRSQIAYEDARGPLNRPIIFDFGIPLRESLRLSSSMRETTKVTNTADVSGANRDVTMLFTRAFIGRNQSGTPIKIVNGNTIVIPSGTQAITLIVQFRATKDNRQEGCEFFDHVIALFGTNGEALDEKKFASDYGISANARRVISAARIGEDRKDFLRARPIEGSLAFSRTLQVRDSQTTTGRRCVAQ